MPMVLRERVNRILIREVVIPTIHRGDKKYKKMSGRFRYANVPT